MELFRSEHAREDAGSPVAPAAKVIVGFAVGVVALTACGSAESKAGASASTGERPAQVACIADLTGAAGSHTMDDSLVRAVLSPEAAVVQPSGDDARPVVIGGSGSLQDALNGTHLWAAAGDGFLVGVSGPDSTTRVDLFDSAGKTQFEGPSFDDVREVYVVGNQFVVDDGESLAAFAVDSGKPIDLLVDEAGLEESPAYSTKLVEIDHGTYGAVLDTVSGRQIDLDDLREYGPRDDIKLASLGESAALVGYQNEERRTRDLWLWAPGGEPREVYSSADEALYYSDAVPGVCGDYLYVPEYGELKVIDTSDENKVVSRMPLPLDRDADEGITVAATPGGLLVTKTTGDGATELTWFD